MQHARKVVSRGSSGSVLLRDFQGRIKIGVVRVDRKAPPGASVVVVRRGLKELVD